MYDSMYLSWCHHYEMFIQEDFYEGVWFIRHTSFNEKSPLMPCSIFQFLMPCLIFRIPIPQFPGQQDFLKISVSMMAASQ